MKTIVELSQSEAVTHLKDHLRCDSVVITKDPVAYGVFVSGDLVVELSRIIYVDFPHTYNGVDKIKAIKQLRERVNFMSLIDAKHAIENPIETIRKNLLTNR
mgnify:CR=1 FL=1